MIYVNEILFWIGIFFLILSLISILYVYVKHKNISTIVSAWIFVVSSIITIIMQQVAIIFGTRAGGNLNFFERYLFSILGIVVFTITFGYVIYICIKALTYVNRLEENSKSVIK
jgi:hypothetical protein